MRIEHLAEPELEFAGGQRHVDVRFGIMTYGPLDRDDVRAPRDIKIGIVGTPETVEGVARWLERCRGGLDARPSRQPNLFPRFPGFSRASPFGADLVLDQRFRREIRPREVVGIVGRATAPGAVDDAVEMFVSECRHIDEVASPDVIVVAPPADLLDALDALGHRAETAEDDRESQARTPDDLDPDETQPPPEPRAFHDVLKARGMSVNARLQMVRPPTYGLGRRRSRRSADGRPLQDEATRAWNFHTAIYYKAGGTPWRIARAGDEYTACFVGVSFYKTPGEDPTLTTSMAQIFDERGYGVIVRGGPARASKEDRQPHLPEADAAALLSAALDAYRREHHTVPARVVVHKTSGFDEDETAGFEAAAAKERVHWLDLVSLRKSSTRLFRAGYYPPLRGTLLSLSDDDHVIYLKGAVDFFQTWPGLYVPRPIAFRRDRAEQTGSFLAAEMLALSKQNWNATQFDGGWPITVRAARQVGAILRHIPVGALVRPQYSYYI
jgi:hypothetical protein